MNNKMLQEILRLLSPSQRKKGRTMVALLCFSSVLDFFSLASFLPIILLVVNSEYAFQNKYLLQLYHLIDIADRSQFAIILTIGVIIFLIIKTQIVRWIIHLKANYAYNVANEMAAKSLDDYLSSGYSQFTNSD